jgi:hypothetical protein
MTIENIFLFLIDTPEVAVGTAQMIQIISSQGSHHKVHINLEYHSVWPLVRSGTSPTPSPHARKSPPPPRIKGGGHNRLQVTGWGIPIRTTGGKAKHSVYILCGSHPQLGATHS